jgi:hypothetical protein
MNELANEFAVAVEAAPTLPTIRLSVVDHTA